MATEIGDPRLRDRRARFDAFFDFYFPRVHGWLIARTKDRESAEQLTEVIMERGLERFDRGEPPEHAAWMLTVARRALAASGRARGTDAAAGREAGPDGDRSTR